MIAAQRIPEQTKDMRTATIATFLLGVAVLPAQDREFGTPVETTLTEIRIRALVFLYQIHTRYEQPTTIQHPGDFTAFTFVATRDDNHFVVFLDLQHRSFCLRR